MMPNEDIASVLADFKKHAGQKFKNDTLAQTFTKYLLYQLFKSEWPYMMNEIYGKDKYKTQEQVRALHAIKREELMPVKESQIWRMIELLYVPSRVQESTSKLVVKNRVTRVAVPLFLQHMKRIAEDPILNPSLGALSDRGFLISITEKSVRERLLIDSGVRDITGTKPIDVQYKVWPALAEMSEEQRNAKLAELSALLAYATVELSPEENATFVAGGLIPQEIDRQQERAKKSQLVETLKKYDKERAELLVNVDEVKLAQHDSDIEKVSKSAGDLSRMRRADVIKSIDYIRECLDILEKSQLDEMGLRRNALERIDALHKERGRIANSRMFNSRTYYQENIRGTEFAHISRPMQDCDRYVIDQYEKELIEINAVLSKYLTLQPQERTRKPIEAGFF